MALTESYLTQVKNLGPILKAIRNGQAPDRFTTRFLSDLGFPSTNDRTIIAVLKGLGFLDDSGAPTERYFTFLDESQSASVLALAIKEAYGDLFRVNNKANEMAQGDVKQKLKTLFRGQKGEAVLEKMARTFTALCELADWSSVGASDQSKEEGKEDEAKAQGSELKIETKSKEEDETDEKPATLPAHPRKAMNLAYTINIQLPSTRDQTVYDAIFRSLREHIL